MHHRTVPTDTENVVIHVKKRVGLMGGSEVKSRQPAVRRAFLSVQWSIAL